MYKIMFSAGEVSGDLHGAAIAKALKKIQPESKLFGFGGEKMRSAGVDILYDMKEYNVMGFWEVLKNLRRMFKLRDDLLMVIQREKPDLLILIDYPDFNWRLAEKAKKLGVPIFSYIPPSAWAWRKGRAKSVAKIADKIVAIFPFELAAYEAVGANIEFVGNPMIDSVKPEMDKATAADYFDANLNNPNVLLLPGSRQQEVTILLPEMLKAAESIYAKYPETQFYLPAAATISRTMLQTIIAPFHLPIRITDTYTYDLMNICDVAVATSGTVTLEAALMELPTVVLYKMSPISYFIGKLFIHVTNFSLPNIIAGERIIPELLQQEVNTERIAREMLALFKGTAGAAAVKLMLAQTKAKLGQPHAVDRIAKLIIEAADHCALQNSNKN
ncbi:lipid-A-disaccharide synthase [Propionispira raffinosivorans]|uniref:lipid-A-disaccharide synthase n=1 Tax=Propionispira raffinosivorans TaxID=86959 RepID=UPI0003787DED|nr:lipid-A-disaccharide synthase [Propionispira raffinosivorans]